ncbi:MAG: DUF6452 family protein [Bacteroidota bacterium]|nr:DUF6452 family protein [Bacteroidota bacterium]
MRQVRHHQKSLVAMLFTMLVMASCSSVDCPLNNTVSANFQLEGNVTKLTDVLTISTLLHNGNDSILLNQLQSAQKFSLPMSYGQDEDVLFFQTGTIKDTVWIAKENHPHFVSVDCGVNFFHTVTGIRYTRNALDSIVINQKEVTYDALPTHFYVYFKEYRY